MPPGPVTVSQKVFATSTSLIAKLPAGAVTVAGAVWRLGLAASKPSMLPVALLPDTV